MRHRNRPKGRGKYISTHYIATFCCVYNRCNVITKPLFTYSMTSIKVWEYKQKAARVFRIEKQGAKRNKEKKNSMSRVRGIPKDTLICTSASSNPHHIYDAVVPRSMQLDTQSLSHETSTFRALHAHACLCGMVHNTHPIQQTIQLYQSYHFHAAFVIECTGKISSHLHGNNLHCLSLQAMPLDKLFAAHNSCTTSIRCWTVEGDVSVCEG